MTLDHYCRDCHHMTASVDGKCRWCASRFIGLGSNTLKPRGRAQALPHETEPDVYRQTNYQPQFRMARGFSILRMGGDQ